MRNLSAIILFSLLMASQIHLISAQDTTPTVSDGNTLVLQNIVSIVTGNITADRNGTMILRNSKVQLSVRGEESYRIIVNDNSTLILENCNITTLNENSTIDISNDSNFIMRGNSSINGFNTIALQNASTFSATYAELNVKFVNGSTDKFELINTNSTKSTMSIDSIETIIDSSSVGKLTLRTRDLDGKNVKINEFNANCSLADLNRISSKFLKIYAENRALVYRANIENSTIFSPRNVTLFDSSFGVLTMGLFGSVYNVTTTKAKLTRAGGMIYASENSTIDRYWYLTINVTDITGFPIPAKIDFYDYDNNFLKSVHANKKGIYYAPTLAEIMSNYTTRFIGNFRLRAFFNITEQVGEEVRTLDTVSTEGILNLDSNKEVRLRFFDVIYGLSPTKISVNPATVRAGSTLTVNGTIRIPMGEELIEVIYQDPNGTKISKLVRTESDGTFKSTIEPDVEGRWMVHADWINGSAYVDDPVTVSRKSYFMVTERFGTFGIILRLFPILITVLAAVFGVTFIFIRARKKI